VVKLRKLPESLTCDLGWEVQLSKNKVKSPTSGATGGPATGAGLNYQINYAVLRALRLFPEVLNFPIRNPFIRVEPRVINGEEITRWDLSFEDQWEVAEAKLSPTKDDLTDWLQRTRQLGVESTIRSVLVFSKSTMRRIGSLRKLIRIAIESGDDEHKFKKLVDLEDIQDRAELMKNLNESPLLRLRRLKLLELPASTLEEQITFYSNVLAGEAGGPTLQDFLFTKFAQAVPSRRTLHIRDLIKEAGARGITINAPPSVDVPGLPDMIREVLLVLREVPLPMPPEVLGRIFTTTEEELRFRFVNEASVVITGSGWKLAPLPLPMQHASAELCARALRALLPYIEAHKYEIVGSRQAYNAMALARRCAISNPEAVARMFIFLDKPLKSLGDKHLVLEAAELTVSAARKRPTGSKADAEGEAQALICGTSWAFQRIGRLDEARNVAEQSLKLGNDIGWERNTAFCEKCIGRLYRIMAQMEKDPKQKARLLQTSVEYLMRAIDRFSQSAEFGSQHPEVGDCYSLLGRTHLVANARSEARKAVNKASALIPPSGGKDYLDLRILEGELIEESDPQIADGYYSEVIDNKGRVADFERSEIIARAYVRRGINRAATKNISAAITDLRKAEDLWEFLGEHENAAEAAWKRLKLEDAIPKSAAKQLTLESALVRVTVMKEHQARLSALIGSKAARRSEPGSEYWTQLIKDARARVAVKSVTW
jgi:tetratricopeptide (TPR) repeat protein